MLSSEFVSVVFRIINFGIVGFSGFYLYRRYFSKAIKASITKNKDYFSNLQVKSKKLKEQSILLDEKIYQQKMMADDLLEKVIKWSASYKIDLDDQIKKQKYINDKIIQKLAIQEELITLSYFHKKILPEVIIEAEKKLRNEFDLKDNVLQFQREIIQFMKKS